MKKCATMIALVLALSACNPAPEVNSTDISNDIKATRE